MNTTESLQHSVAVGKHRKNCVWPSDGTATGNHRVREKDPAATPLNYNNNTLKLEKNFNIALYRQKTRAHSKISALHKNKQKHTKRIKGTGSSIGAAPILFLSLLCATDVPILCRYMGGDHRIVLCCIRAIYR